MKAELRVRAHSLVAGGQVIEVWYGGVFIAQVTGADGPGVRVLSKYPLSVQYEPGAVHVAEIQIQQG